MKTSTKILIALTISTFIVSAFLMPYLIKAVVPSENGFNLNFDAGAWAALAFLAISNILFLVLFFIFLKTLRLRNAIFFSIVPLTFVYGGFLTGLCVVNTVDAPVTNSVKALMKITEQTSVNNYLWASLATIVYLVFVFLIVFFACKPLSKVEKIASRLGDGRLKNDDFKVGGGKQFKEIENSLNKINFNYMQKDNKLKQTNLQKPRALSKQFFKFLGKTNVEELELGNQVKKIATTMLVDLKSPSSKSLSLEENFDYINSYLKIVCPLVRRFDGFVDKYFGDGIMAVFAKPLDAIECANAVLRAIEVKNKTQKDKVALEPKICINTSEVVFSIVGDDSQKLPTIVSNIVEIDQKIQEINQYIGSKLLISKSSLSDLPHSYEFDHRYTGDLSLDGNTKISLYESLCYYPKAKREKLLKLKNKFEEGVRSYNLKDFRRAKENFEFVLHYVSDDKPAYVYFNKACEKLADAV